jgi:hypothetical protein
MNSIPAAPVKDQSPYKMIIAHRKRKLRSLYCQDLSACQERYGIKPDSERFSGYVKSYLGKIVRRNNVVIQKYTINPKVKR